MNSKLLSITILLLTLSLLFSLSGCDVHEWPEKGGVPIKLRLNYDTHLPIWEHSYDRSVESGRGELDQGKIRYIVRVYPKITVNNGHVPAHIEEFVFYKELGTGYNYEAVLDLEPGDYTFMVWSDLLEVNSDIPFYNADNFGEIMFFDKHQGNTDYRDAFRGRIDFSLTEEIVLNGGHTLNITMQRPLAKFEFITTDLAEFLKKEAERLAEKEGEENSDAESIESNLNIEDYKIGFHYVGFMPDTYSMFTDKPVDSSTGVIFVSKPKKLSELEATLGFDYVFVNGEESFVTVQLAVYDMNDELLSNTSPIKVPLKRSWHTIMRGRFLTMEASGGIDVDPEYEGDYNIIF